MAKLITSAQAAALLGVSRPAISKALRAGRIHFADADAKLFDEAALQAAWASNRRRQRTPRPRADAAPAVAEHDDSVPILAKRKLRAEVSILERKAATGPEGLCELAAVQRALFTLRPYARGAIDALHPKLIERADEFCPPGDPRHAAWFGDSFRIGRAVWADVWLAVAHAFVTEIPELRAWFLADAAKERGRAPGDGRDGDR